MITSLEELNNVVVAVANRIVYESTQNTSTGNWIADYSDVQDLISQEDYIQYFDFIRNELSSREEILEMDVTEDHEFDCTYGLAWCPNYEWCSGDEDVFNMTQHQYETTFVAKPVSQPLSMTRKAELLDQALGNIQAELSRSNDDKVVQTAEFFGTSVEELARLGLPAAQEAVQDANGQTKKVAEIEAQRDYTRPIEFEVFSNNDLMSRKIFGSFEEALDAYDKVPAGMEKELYCCTYGLGKIIAEENILLRSNGNGKDWINEHIFSMDPHVRLAAAKAVLSRDPGNLKAWNNLNFQESIIGVSSHRLGPNDLQVGNWRVHLVPPGGHYGVNDCITNNSQQHLVEFYDMRYRNPVHFPNGQFTGGRYYASTLLGDDEWSRGDVSQGLCLDAGIPAWTVSAAQMKVALQFIREETKPKEKTSLSDRISAAEGRAAEATAVPQTEKGDRGI